RQLAGETGKPVRLSLRIAVLKKDVPSFGVAKSMQTSMKGRQTRISVWRAKEENADAGDLPRLLRSGGKRRDEKATCQRSHKSSPANHWTISSARISTDCGILRPSALAVLRLMAKKNVLICSTGKSPGSAPCRKRWTYLAERRPNVW